MKPYFGLRCLLHICPFRQGSDDTGVWGECVDCGKRVGFVDRAALRTYADREWAKDQAIKAAQRTRAADELAAERKRREKCEAVLREVANAPNRIAVDHIIANYFSRYERCP